MRDSERWMQRTCFLCWSSSLEPSYKFPVRFERFSILAYSSGHNDLIPPQHEENTYPEFRLLFLELFDIDAGRS